MSEKSDAAKNDRPMGFPPEGEEVLVQGVKPGDLDDFTYARAEKDPSNPLKGDEPGTIRRAR